MEYELWKSPNIELRKKGTSFKELQSLFINNITIKFIFEPLCSCSISDDSNIVEKALDTRGFDVIGVRNNENEIFGYAERKDFNGVEIKKITKAFTPDLILPESTPISNLLSVLKKNDFSFVSTNENISGIITRADINKPIVRIYLFGIISLFEMQIDFWINKLYKNESWKIKLNDCRICEAEKIYNMRRGLNDDLSLLECLQLGDKKTVLIKTEEFFKHFGFTKSKFKRLMEDIEKIRNEIAHSQKSITSNLKWLQFVETLNEAEEFLNHTENT